MENGVLHILIALADESNVHNELPKWARGEGSKTSLEQQRGRNKCRGGGSVE